MQNSVIMHNAVSKPPIDKMPEKNFKLSALCGFKNAKSAGVCKMPDSKSADMVMALDIFLRFFFKQTRKREVYNSGNK